MANLWEDFIDAVVDDAGVLIKDEVNDLLNSAREDSEEFLRRQGEKIENYLNQLVEKKISKEQFEAYLIDIKDLTEMHALKLSVAGRARAQRLADGITDILIGRLLALI
jgi:hypothetical protein